MVFVEREREVVSVQRSESIAKELLGPNQVVFIEIEMVPVQGSALGT